MCLKARKLATSVEGWRIGWIPSSGAVEALTRRELEGRAIAESIVVGGGEVPGEGVGGGNGGVDVVGKRAARDAVRVRVRLHLLLPLPRLHNVLPQLGRSVSSVDLEVESAGVADGDILLDPPPEGGRGGGAVGTCRPLRPRLA